MPRDRDDPEFFAPLAGIDPARITSVVLGLVHASDGLPGARRRAEAARSVLGDFGVATAERRKT